jgi:RHS repeat-associated protein
VSISQHHLPAASTAPTYDLDGNLTSDGQWTYTWDAEQCARIGSILDEGEAVARRVDDALSRIMNQNRLRSATRSAAALTAGAPYRAISYNYDSLSRKITRNVASSVGGPLTTEKYLYNGWNCIAEYTGTTLKKTNLWGLDLSGTLQGAGGVGGLLLITDHSALLTSHYPCYDGNGNIRKLLNATTLATTATYDYGPFGELIRATGPYAAANSYRFSTKPQDVDTGHVYYNYRPYDTKTGRWLSRDPIGERGGLSLYGMVKNNTLNKIDYLGLACCLEDIAKQKEDLQRRYTLALERLEKNSVRCGGKGDQSCKNTSYALLSALEPIPKCWSCSLERRTRYFGISDHQVVTCKSKPENIGQKGEEVVFDFWGGNTQGVKPDDFRKAYPYPDVPEDPRTGINENDYSPDSLDRIRKQPFDTIDSIPPSPPVVVPPLISLPILPL